VHDQIVVDLGIVILVFVRTRIRFEFPGADDIPAAVALSDTVAFIV